MQMQILFLSICRQLNNGQIELSGVQFGMKSYA